MTDVVDITRSRNFGVIEKTRFFVFFYLAGNPGHLTPGIYRIKANYFPSHKMLIELIRTSVRIDIECIELTGWQELSGSDFSNFSDVS